MERIYGEVGARVRARRLKLQLSLEDLSELSGMHPGYIGQIERGVKKCSLLSLNRLARALGVSPAGLFDSSPRSGRPTFGQLVDAAAGGCSPRDRRILLDVLRRLARSLKEHR